MKDAQNNNDSIPIKKWNQKSINKNDNDQDGTNPEPITVKSVENKNEVSESDNEDNSIQPDFGKKKKSYYKQVLYQALNNDADAQLLMGQFYLSGKYVKKNVVIAIDWLIRSSEECNKDATTLLSEYLKENKGLNLVLCIK